MSNRTVNVELRTLLRETIARSALQAIPFRDYMELCLYAPECGYYNRPGRKIGKEGDFYTSASLGGMMGEALATWIGRLAGEGDEPFELVEWGGGTGALAEQTLGALRERFPLAYERLRFTAIEASPVHRREMAERIAPHAGKVRQADAAAWLAEPDDRFTIVVANELLDAFPVHRLRLRGGEWRELYVAAEGDAFVEREYRCANKELLDYVNGTGVAFADGQTADVNLLASEWIAGTVRRIARGHIVAIDYGDVASELFAPHRLNGTLLCYRHHQAHDDPYAHPGEQDITAHVDFSACITAGLAAGATEWSLATQREFLVEGGLLAMLQEHDGRDPFSPAARRNRAIRQLLLSDGMSELFKVLLMTKRRFGSIR